METKISKNPAYFQIAAARRIGGVLQTTDFGFRLPHHLLSLYLYIMRENRESKNQNIRFTDDNSWAKFQKW